MQRFVYKDAEFESHALSELFDIMVMLRGYLGSMLTLHGPAYMSVPRGPAGPDPLTSACKLSLKYVLDLGRAARSDRASPGIARVQKIGYMTL